MATYLPRTRQVVVTVYEDGQKVKETPIEFTTWAQETIALPASQDGVFLVQDVIKYELIGPARQVTYNDWVALQ